MHYDYIRNLVIQKFGREVKTHYDVLQLQEDMLNKSGKRLSAQTIKRVFGLIKSSSKPDPATLDAIAWYLNFPNYNDLLKWQKISATANPPAENGFASEMVLQILKDIHPENLYEPGLQQMVKNLFVLFERHMGLSSAIYPQLASTEFGRRLFFEQFIHYDGLAFNYGDALEHFLIYENEPGHRAFALCMLILRNYLTKNHEACRFYFSQLSLFSQEQIHEFHPFIIGRYYGSKVLMNAIEGKNSAAYVEEQVQQLLLTERRATDLYHGYPCAEMVFAEALVLSGHFAQAHNLLSKGPAKEYQHPARLDITLKTHFEVIKLVAATYAGKLSTAAGRKEMTRLSSAPIFFLSHNYINWLLCLVKAKLKIEPKLTQKKVAELAQKLGFPPAVAFV